MLLKGLKILNVSFKESFNSLTFFTIVLRLTYLMVVVTQFGLTHIQGSDG